MLHIEINNVEGCIIDGLNANQLATISNVCSFRVNNAEYKAQTLRKKGCSNWDGQKRLFDTSRRTFPIGLLNRITKLLDGCGIIYDIDDRRTRTPKTFDCKCTPKEIRQYQTDAVFKSLINESGVLKAATGSGKTTIGAMTIQAYGQNAVFIVHTKDLLYQTIESFKYLFDDETLIGQIGDGVFKPNKITVATVQSLAQLSKIDYVKYTYDEDYIDTENKMETSKELKKKCRAWANTVGVLIFDEVQRVASQTAYDSRFMFYNARHAFGYSASPWRNDGADMMIEGAFGSIFHNITASELIQQNYLMKPTIIINKIQDGVWSGKAFSSIYRTAIVENLFRNMQIINDAIEYHNRGLNTLILVTQVKHGKMLNKMINDMGIDCEFISGKSKMKHRKQVVQDMRDGRCPLAIATTIADVGLDVPRLEVIVEAGAGKSSITALQRLGRIMRKFTGKKECIFITYRDTAPYIYKHINEKIRIWRTEPEFNIIETSSKIH